ncbi:NAD-dependent epimerase/dehydratase family protein [Allorhizobium borbori]|uniref:dTDP-L-rhamnose 4-epimerase n=1 Tax=Allorhizobium borbori TaxID=485907 RepID=A0A7W6K6H2_9HYPH|nr:SDR family oxidoreductase [Allorhizobium borbori]MBB4106017.1 dTDP-L-rhamnose 4-epimerase [Allorhizobium borbori]
MDCILITGGAGFIGCKLSSLLEDFGLPIVAIDSMHPQVHSSSDRPELMPNSVILHVGDVCDCRTWDAVLNDWKPRILIHLAAETGTGQSLTEASLHAQTNVVGTTRMLDALSSRGVLPDHILLSSSRAVYGEGAWRKKSGEICYPGIRKASDLKSGIWSFTDEQGEELTPLSHRAGHTNPNPTSVYGSTKLAQENILSAWCAAMNIPLSILRFQNVYGPGQAPFNVYTGIINIFFRVARGGAPIDIYEDGNIGRDFVFIDDVARACKAALQSVPNGSRLLDVGSGTVTTVLEAAKAIAKISSSPAPEVSGKFRPGDVRWAVAEAGDLKQQLGVVAKVPFVEGVTHVGEWLIRKGYV